MDPGGAQPVIHEVNTWVWLEELTRQHGRAVTLGDVPEKAWDAVVAPGVAAVWLMGVWQRSPAGRVEARNSPGLRQPHLEALPDLTDDDIVGSPYCIRSYTVDERLGGDAGLATARAALAQRGAKLIVDYVPNHVAHDHPWVAEHPDYFVCGTSSEAAERSGEFVELSGEVFAFGRDPYFAPWTDVVQLNAFSGGLRNATTATLTDIASRADGVRCDMAMLLLKDVFARTWGERAGLPPADEFWPAVIASVRAAHPQFAFLAEVYWDLEPVLLDQGFDYCYDKRLYDRLVHGSPQSVRDHLGADLGYQRRMVRFLENHDEPRSAATLPAEALRAAAVVVLTLPGATLLYEGQFTGRRSRPPVALGRRPDEPKDDELEAFYLHLLGEVDAARLRAGTWRLCRAEGWPDNASADNLLTWAWDGDARHLVVVNWSAQRSAGKVAMDAADLPGKSWVFTDVLTGERYHREGADLAASGLHVDLPPWGAHVFRWADQ